MSNYGHLVQRFKQNLLRDGKGPTEVNEAFGEANPSELEFLMDLYKTFSQWLTVFMDEELEDFKKYTVPDVVLDFYSKFEPQYLPTLKGGINLLGLSEIKLENSSAVPSMYLIKYGLLTIATTVGGNVICIDLNDVINENDNPRVVIVDYTFISYNDDLNVVECVNVSDEMASNFSDDEPIVLNYDIIKKCLPQITGSFSDFIKKLAYEEFDNIEKEYLVE